MNEDIDFEHLRDTTFFITNEYENKINSPTMISESDVGDNVILVTL